MQSSMALSLSLSMFQSVPGQFPVYGYRVENVFVG